MPPQKPAEAPADSTNKEPVLPIKRHWFDLIASGRKTAEFREASAFWRARLLDGQGFTRVRLINGRFQTSATAYLVVAVNRVEVLPVASIPEGLAPAAGTPAHQELFRGATEVICLHLGSILELYDPKKAVGARKQKFFFF